LQGHQSFVNSASFSPDSQHIVTASSDNTARVWKVESLDELLKLGCRWLKSYYLAFSPRQYKNNAFEQDVNKESISQDLKLCADHAQLK
jgi:WD40 repeat protein